MSEKKPRLFYYEEAISALTLAPDLVENIIEADQLRDGESVEITFKRIDMTDEELGALPED